MSRFFLDLRLDYIAWRVSTTGTIGRADLVRSFDISPSQATNDLTGFAGMHPGVIRYDTTAKCYLATGRKCKREHPAQRLMALE